MVEESETADLAAAEERHRVLAAMPASRAPATGLVRLALR